MFLISASLKGRDLRNLIDSSLILSFYLFTKSENHKYYIILFAVTFDWNSHGKL